MHPKNCLIIGHANSYKGYIPTQTAIQEGGYEPEAFYNVNLPAPYALEMEKVLVGAITREAKEQFLELESS